MLKSFRRRKSRLQNHQYRCYIVCRHFLKLTLLMWLQHYSIRIIVLNIGFPEKMKFNIRSQTYYTWIFLMKFILYRYSNCQSGRRHHLVGSIWSSSYFWDSINHLPAHMGTLQRHFERSCKSPAGVIGCTGQSYGLDSRFLCWFGGACEERQSRRAFYQHGSWIFWHSCQGEKRLEFWLNLIISLAKFI